MELRLVEKTKTTLKIEVIDEDMTLITPIVEELLKDPKVESAMYKQGHPGLDIPLLIVEVKSGKPEALLRKTVKSLGKTYGDLRDVMGAKMDKL